MDTFRVKGQEINYKDFVKINTSFAKLFKFIPFHYQYVEITRELFPTIIANALIREKCRTISDLLRWSPAKLHETRNIGKSWFCVTVNTLIEYCRKNKGKSRMTTDVFEFPDAEFSELRDILSSNIQNWRKSVNISQEGLAVDCGLDKEYIADIENCNADPRLSTLIQICGYMCCSVTEILTPHRY